MLSPLQENEHFLVQVLVRAQINEFKFNQLSQRYRHPHPGRFVRLVLQEARRKTAETEENFGHSKSFCDAGRVFAF